MGGAVLNRFAASPAMWSDYDGIGTLLKCMCKLTVCTISLQFYLHKTESSVILVSAEAEAELRS